MRRHRQPKRVHGLWILIAVCVILSSLPSIESSYEIMETHDDICPGEGFFPNPHSCTKFYRCVETFHFYYAYEFECPRRTVFDPDIKICNHPYAVHPKHKCFFTNLLQYKAKEIIHVINDTTIHQFVRDSNEIEIR